MNITIKKAIQPIATRWLMISLASRRYWAGSSLQLEPKCFEASSNLSGECRMLAPAENFLPTFSLTYMIKRFIQDLPFPISGITEQKSIKNILNNSALMIINEERESRRVGEG
jgi:hypothetical protein